MPIKDDDFSRLVQARERYDREVSPNYDEALEEVSARIEENGSLSKADIGALVFWKRLRANAGWVTELHRTSDAEVRATTAEAVKAGLDESVPPVEAVRKGRAALAQLPGFGHGDALASAVLFAAAPDRLAVYDRRAHAGLRQLGLVLTDRSGRYSRYIAVLEELRAQASEQGRVWTVRDVDKALYILGGGPGEPDERGMADDHPAS